MRRGARRARSSTRAALVVVTALVALAWGAQSLHMTLVAHDFCRAHGQLEHGEGAHGAEERGDTASRGPAAAAEERDPHDHCDAVGTASVLVAEAPHAQAHRLEARAPAGLRPATWWTGSRLWLLAPKGSPPRAGYEPRC